MTDPFAPLGPSSSGSNPPKPPQWTSVVPVPPEAPEPPRKHPELGSPSARWVYGDAQGELLGFVCRFDRPGRGKEFRPLALFASPDGDRLAWRWQFWDAPRPLYGLERLAKLPTAAVIVCEGEKAADAAGRLLPDFVTVTSSNGSNAAAKTDWSPLAGRRVIIWPDADAAGEGYADAVAKLLFAAGAASVARVTPPGGVADKWDAADAEGEGWTEEDAAELIGNALSLATPNTASKKPTGRDGDEGDRAKHRRPRQSNSLMALTEFCDFWRDPGGETYVTIPVNGHRENWALRDEVFKQWLSKQAYEQTGLIPTTQSVEDTIRVLQARTIFDGRVRTPWVRVGSADGRYYIDLGDPSWKVIEIEAHGWRVLDRHDTPFIRSASMSAFPEPEGGYPIDLLRNFVNCADEDDFILLVAWLVAALRSTGPYPILVLNGEQGTGKSVLSELIRGLCDPNVAPIRSAALSVRDFWISAVDDHVMVLDNMSHVEPWLSDCLCKLSTGAAFTTRQLMTDRRQTVIKAQRPIVLNGIPMLTDRPDLADRAITIRLRVIPEDARRPLDQF